MKKPKRKARPREWWAVVDGCGYIVNSYHSKDVAKAWFQYNGTSLERLVHVREVLPRARKKAARKVASKVVSKR